MIYSQMRKEILSKINQGKIIKNPAPQILRPRGNWEKCTKLSVVDFTACALCVCSMDFKVPLEIKKKRTLKWGTWSGSNTINIRGDPSMQIVSTHISDNDFARNFRVSGSLISTYQEYFHPSVNRVGIGYDLVFSELYCPAKLVEQI